MKRIVKIILVGTAIAVIGAFGAREVLAKQGGHDGGARHYEQNGEQDRHADRGRDHRGGKSAHRENRRGKRHATNQHAGNQHAGNQHAGNQHKRRGTAHNNAYSSHNGWHYRANYRSGHGYRRGWHGSPYAHHINAAYSHGAVHCRPVSHVGYVRGYRALLGGIMCVDRHGIAFVIPQTRHVIHTY